MGMMNVSQLNEMLSSIDFLKSNEIPVILLNQNVKYMK